MAEFREGGEDFQQAEWLTLYLNGEWRYDHTSERWHHWNGKRWAPDQTREIENVVASLAARSFDPNDHEVEAPKGEAERKARTKLMSLPAIRRALEALATFPGYGTNGDDWDTVPYLLGVNNGIVDLRTNTLIRRPTPDMLVTKTTKVDFEPVSGPEEFRARAPRFMNVLNDWMSGDSAMQAFLLLWFGASLFGFSPEQRFLLMTGIGRNGKGTFKHAVIHAVGEYGEQMDANLYMRSKFGAARSDSARADLLKLKGIRITFFSEPEGNRFNEEMLKAHTGGDVISARALYSNNIQTWEPTHSITFLVNDVPELDDLGPSMAARVMVADFRERYDGEKEDKLLYRDLEKEAPGILAILCWAAKEWYASWSAGEGGISLPERVIEQSKAFMERNDPVANWLNERVKAGVGLRTPGQLAYDSFVEWWRTLGEPGDPMSLVKFTSTVEKKGFKRFRTAGARGFEGFKLLGAVDLAEREADDDEA